MRQEYEADVIETLESTFGEIENKSSLAEAIMGAARNAAEDNIPDYLQDLYYATEGSSFEEVEEDIVAFIYKNVVTNSVAYMMMSRLGVDTDGYFELDDFRDVTNFNTQETLNALGFATSDIAEMGFKEGNLLEPSCGIGNFIGMLPDAMQDSKIYGVELDTISAGIAQQLYQKTTIAAQGFEETNLPDSFFDGVVGNVPFGDFKVLWKKAIG